MGTPRETISRILAVGSPAPDGVHRVTQGDFYVCCEGGEQEHQQMRDFCREVESLLQASGQELGEFTPEEFSQWIRAFQGESRRA